MTTSEHRPGEVHPSRDAFCECLASAILGIDRAAASTDNLEAEIDVCFAIADLRRALAHVGRAPAALTELWADQEKCEPGEEWDDQDEDEWDDPEDESPGWTGQQEDEWREWQEICGEYPGDTEQDDEDDNCQDPDGTWNGSPGWPEWDDTEWGTCW